MAGRTQSAARQGKGVHQGARRNLSAARRDLPWVKVEKNYVFDDPSGKETLADLFGGKSQLIVYHFMLGPGWEQGCPSCSFLADHFDGAAIHLAQRDVTLVVVSRAPLAEIEAYKKRMGWKFKWVSSFGNDFNHDFHVSFTQGRGGQRRRVQLHGREDPQRRTTRPERIHPGRERQASFTPIRRTRAASTSWSAPTISSTWRRRAATKTPCPGPWPGCAGTSDI